MSQHFSSFSQDNVRLFSGRSNPALASSIAENLGVRLEPTHFSRFSNDNLFVQLGASVRGRLVYIVQSLVPPVSDHLMELLMMLDIAKSAAAKEIHAVIPYFSYARSDKKDAPRISITARLVADLLHTAGATHIMTMTLHSPQVHGFFSVPADPLTARGLIADYLLQRQYSAEDTVVVSPDVGSAKSAARFAEMMGLGVATANKTRLDDTRVQYSGLIGRQVSGYRRALIHDDEIATGGTIVELTHLLREHGLEEIIVICTHGVFLRDALERLEAIPEIVEIITTDTVPQSPGPDSKLAVLSTGPVFAGAIMQNYHHRSIGELFDFGDRTMLEE
ncbi:putative ribose-phosphate pyrophosphokinase [Candidatus Promineifilum breve]|uniref:ribose-phosphate diphosphokinase n=1 Tax=Candidatus Promineifilum breve TaxID=1806508 RepID=A0A160SY03_9CHLR|nr:ribose-phosphate pyrophosphokinase [Candidatus Promineifilum breve]CUS02281.2 putative ribose-phosphate pyrophosphokinase [Candidatus Promineifilum breve]